MICSSYLFTISLTLYRINIYKEEQNFLSKLCLVHYRFQCMLNDCSCEAIQNDQISTIRGERHSVSLGGCALHSDVLPAGMFLARVSVQANFAILVTDSSSGLASVDNNCQHIDIVRGRSPETYLCKYDYSQGNKN